MPDTQQAREVLEQQLEELRGRLANIERDLNEPHDPDSSERAVQMEDDEALEGQEALVTRQIASTERALHRIDNGEYGHCIQCGEEISENRLAVRPEAALCIACASKN